MLKNIVKKLLVPALLIIAITVVPKFEAMAYSTNYVVNNGEIANENPASIFKKPYCFYNDQGIEIWGEKESVVNVPMDGDAARDILVINKGSTNLRIEQNGNPKLSGKMASYTEEQLIIFHPNAFVFELKPGESQRGTMTVSFGNMLRNLKNNITGSTLTITQSFSVSSKDESGNNYERLQSFSISLPIKVNAYTQSYISSNKNRTATIKGYVKDEKGKAIANAIVTIKGGALDAYTVKTDKKGFYSTKVYATKNGYSGKWHEYVLKVEKSGYADKSVVVYPESKKTTTSSFKLSKASKKLTYTQTKKIDLGVQAYSFDASKDGNVIAFIPFHSALSYDKIKNKMNLTVVSKTGKLLYQNKLPGETPYVDVSENGAYVTTIQEITNNGDIGNAYSIPTIWDKSGNIVYSREYFPDNELFLWSPTSFDSDNHRISSKCTKLSNDNNLLYVGSCDGELFCIDWKSDTILWSGYLENQIRTIDFSKDNKYLYATSGNGYLYCYDINGTFIWKSYIGSWGVDIKIGTKYIAVTSKCDVSGIRLLDAKTGKQKWSYDAPARGSGIVFSPDEKLLWWGNDTCASYNAASSIVFDVSTGKIKFALDSAGQMADWTADGKYLAVKTAKWLYVYDGKTGETLWSKEIVKGYGENGASISFSLYYSDDSKYLVSVFNNDTSERSWGQAYFFKRK